MTHFWQDENTGILNHQLVYMDPVPFKTALAWAKEHAPTRQIERIHVKHARAKKAPEQEIRSKSKGKNRTTKMTTVKKTALARKHSAAKSRRK